MSSADPDQNLSPAERAERDLQEKERQVREAAEQAQLPYKWTQTIRDLEVSAPIPSNIKGRDMVVTLTKSKISVAINGQEPILEVRLSATLPPLSSLSTTSPGQSNHRLTLKSFICSGRIPPPHSRR
jgi:hypothetical protein